MLKAQKELKKKRKKENNISKIYLNVALSGKKKASLTEGALELQMNITESQMTGGGERGSGKSSRQHAPALRE